MLWMIESCVCAILQVTLSQIVMNEHSVITMLSTSKLVLREITAKGRKVIAPRCKQPSKFWTPTHKPRQRKEKSAKSQTV